MLKSLVILTVIVAVAYAASPVPRKAANPKASGSQAVHAQANKSDDPSNLAPLTQQANSYTLTDEAKGNAPKDGWDKAGIFANWALVIIGLGGVWYARNTLRGIREQLGEIKAASLQTDQMIAHAGKQGDIALLYAQAFINAERPWILVKFEESERFKGRFQIIAVNKGRTPAVIVATADNLILVDPIEFPPSVAKYGKPDTRTRIVLPDDSVTIGEVSQDSIKDVGNRTRFNSLELEGYVFGVVSYSDTLRPEASTPHETRWCFHVLPWQEKEVLIVEFRYGSDEYTRHT